MTSTKVKWYANHMAFIVVGVAILTALIVYTIMTMDPLWVFAVLAWIPVNVRMMRDFFVDLRRDLGENQLTNSASKC